MIGLLVSASVLVQRSSSELDSDIQAVQRFVTFAKSVEEACSPRLLTSPPEPFHFVPHLTPYGAMATPLPGGYGIDYGNLVGTVRGDTITLTVSPPRTLPKGLPLWSEEEAIASARRVSNLLCSAPYRLGTSTVRRRWGRLLEVVTDFVTPPPLSLSVGQSELTIDRATGAPGHVESGARWPAYRPERLVGLKADAVLLSEAVRVHRSLPLFGSGRLAPPRLVYMVPSFSHNLNEMTDEQRSLERQGEAIPLYEWRIGRATGGSMQIRTVYVDARSGRGVAVLDWDLPMSGTSAKVSRSRLDQGRWRCGTAEGAFAIAEAATFEGSPILVSNAGREIVTVHFDRKSGLVRDETGTYRPDAALLTAMRAEGPPRPFGKR